MSFPSFRDKWSLFLSDIEKRSDDTIIRYSVHIACSQAREKYHIHLIQDICS